MFVLRARRTRNAAQRTTSYGSTLQKFARTRSLWGRWSTKSISNGVRKNKCCPHGSRICVRRQEGKGTCLNGKVYDSQVQTFHSAHEVRSRRRFSKKKGRTEFVLSDKSHFVIPFFPGQGLVPSRSTGTVSKLHPQELAENITRDGTNTHTHTHRHASVHSS